MKLQIMELITGNLKQETNMFNNILVRGIQ